MDGDQIDTKCHQNVTRFINFIIINTAPKQQVDNGNRAVDVVDVPFCVRVFVSFRTKSHSQQQHSAARWDCPRPLNLMPWGPERSQPSTCEDVRGAHQKGDDHFHKTSVVV